jgi:hypothetical protein
VADARLRTSSEGGGVHVPCVWHARGVGGGAAWWPPRAEGRDGERSRPACMALMAWRGWLLTLPACVHGHGSACESECLTVHSRRRPCIGVCTLWAGARRRGRVCRLWSAQRGGEVRLGWIFERGEDQGRV